MARKVALITGSSRGLGRSLALSFARGGYDLILHGRSAKRLDKVAADTSSVQRDVIKGDITQPGTISALVAMANKRGIDVFVNNAGIYAGLPLIGMTDEGVRRIIDTNLVAPILLTRRIFPLFKKGGLIVNINSVAGKEPGMGESVYCASKHGLRGFSRSMQFDATACGVRLMDFYFGAIKTDMVKSRKDFKKFMDPDEAADIVFALCVDHESARLKEIDIGRKKY